MDISVYDNYSGVSRGFDFFQIDNNYKICDSLLAIICLRGTATFRIRLHDFEIKRCHSLVIGPDTPFYISKHSKDFHVDVVRVGEEAIYAVANEEFMKMDIDRLIFERPLNFISERKTRMFHIIHSYMKVLLTEHEDKYRSLTLLEYLKIFFFEACHILESNEQKSHIPRKERVITNRFFKLAENNFKENRKVEFYAREIGISHKHLANTMKKTTGKYPSEWLEDYAILEAKKMLRYSDDSVQNIAFDLNFATPSHFGKFFKAKTGLTPKQFRDNIKEIYK